MSDVQVEVKKENKPDVNIVIKIEDTEEEKTTLIDSLLDENSFTSIENLKDIDNDDTIINSSYTTNVDDKKTAFLDILKQTDKALNEDYDYDSVNTTVLDSKQTLNRKSHHRIASIDDQDGEIVDDLVNNKFLKKIKSNDSLELKYKSISKLDNVENLNINIENENENENENEIEIENINENIDEIISGNENENENEN